MDYELDEFFTNAVGDMFIGGLAIFFIIFFIILALICLVSIVLSIVGTWKILEKAGKPGWNALIPYYNSFQLCDITGVRPIWVIATLAITIIGSVISGICGSINILPFLFISPIIRILSFAASVYFSILLNVSLAKSFGKEDSFAIGLVLLPPVFYLILGTDSSKYLGPKPMKDNVYEFVNDKIDLSCFGSLVKSSETKEGKGEFVKKCPLCGNKNPEKSKFCSTCGSKL